MPVAIRDERPGDQPAIRKVIMAAFGGSAEADLVERLRADGDAVISLVSVEGGTMLGHILLSRLRAPFRALGLAPLSVVPDRQASGIGSRLVREGLDRAGRLGWQGVFVVGEPRFYGRFGFDANIASGFQSPYAGAYLMAVSLIAAFPATSGRLEYPAAFAGLS